MAKEVSTGSHPKDSTSSHQHYAGTKTSMQPPRDTSQNHSKGAHLSKEGLEAVTGVLSLPMC